MSTRSPPGKRPGDADESPARWVNSSALGIQVVITFIVLVWAGIWVDGKFGWDPWGTLGGVALGLLAMFTTMLREAGMLKSLATREQEAADREAAEAERAREENTRTEAEDERGPS